MGRKESNKTKQNLNEELQQTTQFPLAVKVLMAYVMSVDVLPALTCSLHAESSVELGTIYGHRREKTCLRGLRTSKAQTSMRIYAD